MTAKPEQKMTESTAAPEKAAPTWQFPEDPPEEYVAEVAEWFAGVRLQRARDESRRQPRRQEGQ